MFWIAKDLSKGLRLQNKIFVVNRSVNYAELVELIYYTMGQSLLKTGGSTKNLDNFITIRGHSKSTFIEEGAAIEKRTKPNRGRES